ncbi:O-antigen ligase family protein [Terrarubrum flagellatum]|uniref:O-antigen ligase family protein n=1 Tax=Terrirubrum flagellatum TaxID=2895980 RepID=UPI0031456BF2
MTARPLLIEAAPQPWPRGPHPFILGLHRLSLGLLVFTGAFVVFDGPYNAAFIFAAVVMIAGGARLNAPLAPMIVITLVYVMGGLASLIGNNLDDFIPQRYIFTMFFLACTAFYFAMVIQEETTRRIDIIRKATIASAVISCFIGLIGFFDVAGLAQYFRVYEGRASGTFRDPNVFGSFLILPAIFLLQDLIVGRRGLWWRATAFLLIALMIFLSFSRGSWVAFALAGAMLFVLTAVTERDKAGRLMAMSLAALIVFALLAVAVLSIDDIRSVFEQRAKLLQSYDEGRFGRFGKLVYALPLMLENPNGLGPLRFRNFFFEDPHNVYLNGFVNFGWLGGLSYLALIVSTCVVGFKICMQPSPWRREAIAIFCSLFTQVLQGFQIDTNTWRHFNMMIGLIWGIMAAWTLMKKRAKEAPRAHSAPPPTAVQAAIPASAIIAAR